MYVLMFKYNLKYICLSYVIIYICLPHPILGSLKCERFYLHFLHFTLSNNKRKTSKRLFDCQYTCIQKCDVFE